MNDRQLDMVLGYLNEGIEIDREEYINEGLFSKLKDLFKKDKSKTKNDNKYQQAQSSLKSTLTQEEKEKVLKESIKIAKKVLDNFKKECKNHENWDKYIDCFELIDLEDDDNEDFITGDSKYASIVWYDLWKIKGSNARGDFDDIATGDTWCWIMDELQKNIVGKVNNVVHVEYGGDWDDGPINIITK